MLEETLYNLRTKYLLRFLLLSIYFAYKLYGISMDALKLENQLCHRFYVASNAITRTYRPFLAELDLTYPQYVTMMALWEQDKITINELVSKTRIDNGAMSLILRKLHVKKLILINSCKTDKRVKFIKLSANGKKLQDQAIDIPYKVAGEIAPLDPQEREQLTVLLDKLIFALSPQSFPDIASE